MDSQYRPGEIDESDREDLEEHMYEASSSRAKRGALSLGKFKHIARLAWSKEEGLIPE